MSFQKTERYKREFVISIFLVVFLLGGFVFVKLKQLELNLDFRFPRSEGMVSPISPPTEEEKIKKLLGLSGINFESIKQANKSYEITLLGNLTVLFSSERDYSFQVATLQLILERSRIEGRMPKKIDLRFDKPVLIY